MAVGHPRSREFSLSEGEFNQIRALVRAHTGISLAPSKRELVYGRLVRRLRRLKLDTFPRSNSLGGSGGETSTMRRRIGSGRWMRLM